MSTEKFNIHQHLAKLEELADAFALDDGSAMVLARRWSVPASLAKKCQNTMRSCFLTGALAASGLLVDGDHDVPPEWLRANGIPEE